MSTPSEQGDRPGEPGYDEKIAALQEACQRVAELVGEQTRDKLGTPPSDDGLAAAMAGAGQAAVDLLARAREASGAPDVACGSGCGFCCHQMIVTTPPEVLELAAWLRRNRTPEALAALTQSLAEVDALTRGLSSAERALLRTRCPLLDRETWNCTVYEARPLVCRGHNSLDRSVCERNFTDPTAGIEVPGFALESEMYHAVRNGLMAGVAALGLEERWLELIAALRIALEQPDARARWLAGEPVFAEAEARFLRESVDSANDS